MDTSLKNKILDAAQELFILQGYDKTSTSDIMKKANIARGTLYNHFASKEAVLDGVIGRLVTEVSEKAAYIAAKREVPVLNRITMAILALNISDELNEVMLNEMHKPQNALLHQKTQYMLLETTAPIIAGLVEEGNGEGVFSTPFPKEAVEMILLYSYIMFDDLNIQGEEEKNKRIQGFICNAERLLGAKEGALQKVIMDIINRKPEGEQDETKI